MRAAGIVVTIVGVCVLLGNITGVAPTFTGLGALLIFIGGFMRRS